MVVGLPNTFDRLIYRVVSQLAGMPKYLELIDWNNYANSAFAEFNEVPPYAHCVYGSNRGVI